MTVVEAGPCTVVQVQTQATDGYDALQLGFEPKQKNVTQADGRPLQEGRRRRRCGCCARCGSEVRVDGYQVGQTLTVELFTPGELVDVAG